MTNQCCDDNPQDCICDQHACETCDDTGVVIVHQGFVAIPLPCPECDLGDLL